MGLHVKNNGGPFLGMKRRVNLIRDTGSESMAAGRHTPDFARHGASRGQGLPAPASPLGQGNGFGRNEGVFVEDHLSLVSAPCGRGADVSMWRIYHAERKFIKGSPNVLLFRRVTQKTPSRGAGTMSREAGWAS